MQRVAVFGNAGGGKSTLARRLAEITGLPLYPLDLIQYTAAGEIPREQFLAAHAALLSRDAWIIDGYGTTATAWERFAAADTLIYVDLPRRTHYWWVIKRHLKSPWVKPEGWPDHSPMWESTWSGLRVVGLCHRHLTPKYRALVAEAAASKRVHHLRSPREMRDFLAAVVQEQR